MYVRELFPGAENSMEIEGFLKQRGLYDSSSRKSILKRKTY